VGTQPSCSTKRDAKEEAVEMGGGGADGSPSGTATSPGEAGDEGEGGGDFGPSGGEGVVEEGRTDVAGVERRKRLSVSGV
jgi:hypothetical protein